jgi:hypothetical protein
MIEPEGLAQLVPKSTITDTSLSHFSSPAIFAKNLGKFVSLFTRLRALDWSVLEKIHTNMVYEFSISPSQVHAHKIVAF